MSSEQIVNRVAITPALQAELKEAGLDADNKVVNPNNADNEKLSVLAQAAPAIDEVLDNPVVQEEVQRQGLAVDEDLLSSFRALVGSSDQKAFRSQVIRAFKHLGLDTKKFFGE